MNGKIVAKDRGNFIEFPGGGVDEFENSEKAMKREAFEEAGIILKGKLKQIGFLNFVWDKEWAKTEKQKKRYEDFQGEEMYFFLGNIESLSKPSGDQFESGWSGDILMEIDEVIKKIKEYGWTKDLEEYRNFQIKTLENLKNEK